MLTLAQVYAGMPDKMAAPIIDEFRKSSWLLDNLIFDDTTVPGSSGSSWNYTYQRFTQQANAEVRGYGVGYTASEAAKQEFTVPLKILGGSFEVDRAFVNTAGSAANIVTQIEQKRKAVMALFNHLVINGDSGVDAREFDGLDAILAGSSTEYIPTTTIDLSTTASITANADRFSFEFNEFLSRLDSTDGVVLLTNKQMVGRLRALAQKLSSYTTTIDQIEEGRQRQVERFMGIPFVDMGERNGSTLPVVQTTATLTDIYAIRIGVDGFHGVMPNAREDFIRVYLPDMSSPSVVKSGELEMITTVALKSTKAAGVFRNLKVE